jgi:hypothetical protein
MPFATAKIVALDYFGFGRSDKPAAEAILASYIDTEKSHAQRIG